MTLFGFSLSPDLPNLSAIAFADDVTLISKDTNSTRALIDLAENHLASIGLHVNPSKSKLIYLHDGTLTPLTIQSTNNLVYNSLTDKSESIKYLGLNINDEIVIDSKTILTTLTKNISNLCSSPLLQADQKLSIINEYIWPSFVYPLQSAPLSKIKPTLLDDIDKILRSAVKEIINLPHDCPNSMIYAPKQFRGLGLMKAKWEAYIQHYNICKILSHVDDPHLHRIRDFGTEKHQSLLSLGIKDNIHQDLSGRQLRKHLRIEEFQNWSSHKIRGKGVLVFADVPKCNNWVSRRKGLSVSEWSNALKMSCNISAVRAIPGRSLNTLRCRYNSCSEIETLSHVLGFCAKGELQRNSRHHRVRSAIASFLRSKKWQVYEEVHCLSTEDSTRRVDIVAIDPKNKNGYVLDPTVRFENSLEQAEAVDREKQDIYEPCLPYLSSRYNIPLSKWKVHGLLFGARGSITKFVYNILLKLGFSINILCDILLVLIKDSLGILHHHLYFSN